MYLCFSAKKHLLCSYTTYYHCKYLPNIIERIRYSWQIVNLRTVSILGIIIYYY